jgi:hypothetical protein
MYLFRVLIVVLGVACFGFSAFWFQIARAGARIG